MNKYIDARIKKIAPSLNKEDEKTVVQSGDLFTIGLEYPSTIEDIARLKAEALQKLNAFYQAEHIKLAEKVK